MKAKMSTYNYDKRKINILYLDGNMEFDEWTNTY